MKIHKYFFTGFTVFIVLFSTFHVQNYLKGMVAETKPYFFESLEALLKSNEFSNPKPAELIYLAIGPYVKAMGHQKSGYAQALPLFVENILRNEELRPQLKIILIDPSFTENNYIKSDLYRHLNENNLTRFAYKFYVVHNQITNKQHKQPVENYLYSVLKKGGAVFLFDAAAAFDIRTIYNELIKKDHAIYAKERRIFYMYTCFIDFYLPTTDANKKVSSGVEFWDGKPYIENDSAYIFGRALFLNKLVQGFSKRDLHTEEASTAKSELNENIDLVKKATTPTFNPSVLTEALEKEDAAPEKKLDCTLGSLLPTKNPIPLVDFKITLIKDKNLPAYVKVEPMISVDKDQLDILGLIKDKNKLLDFVFTKEEKSKFEKENK